MPKVGDLVVYRYSKAKNLKNRLYKVIEHVDTNKVRCVNIHGKSKVFSNYCLQTLVEHEWMLSRSINSAQVAVIAAQDKELASRRALILFKEQRQQAPSYFPTF